MNLSTITNGNRRKRIARIVFTPTEASNATPSHYLVYFIETESYQIVARSSIKQIDDNGCATILIRHKMLQGKIIHFGNC